MGLLEARRQVRGLGIRGHVLEYRNLIVHGFEARHGFPVVARPFHEVHFDARFGLKAKLRQLQLRNGLGGEPGSELIEHREFHPDLVRQPGGAPITLLPQNVGKRFAVGQKRTREHFSLHLGRTDLFQIHFHEDGFGIHVRLQHGGCQRVVAEAQHVNGAEQIHRIVFAMQFPK